MVIGYWLGGYWYWHDENSRCAIQTRRYNDYMVITGVLTASTLYNARSYSYYNTYRSKPSYRSSVTVNKYYGTSGKVINQSTYKTQQKTYTTSRNTWKTDRKKFKETPKFKSAFAKAKTVDKKPKATPTTYKKPKKKTKKPAKKKK